MRILFDKGTPRLLRRRLFEHEVETSVERGRDTLPNGVLMNISWPHIARNTEVVRITLEGLQPGELREVPIP